MEEIIFPNQIRMLRRVRGRSMQELADFLDVSLSAVSKIEKGYRRIDQEQLVRIAEFLSCSLEDIFVNENTSTPEVVKAWQREQDRRKSVNERGGLKKLGAGLRHLRNQKGMTLAEVADNAGLTLSVYHRIEMGQREVSDKELGGIAGALNMSEDALRGRIDDLSQAGALDELIQRNEARLRLVSGPGGTGAGASAMIGGQTAAVAGRDVPVFGSPGADGTIVVDRENPVGSTLGPPELMNAGDGYGINLCTRRLGNLLPARSVLFVDPSQMVGLGDIAAVYLTDQDVRLASIREEEDGKLYGLMWNPEERLPLDETRIEAMHRVVSIRIP